MGRKPVLCAASASALALAVLAATALPGAAGAATSASAAQACERQHAGNGGRGLRSAWTSARGTRCYSSGATVGTVESYLKAAGIDQLHYGGGGIADQYDWQNNYGCSNPDCGPAPTLDAFTAACATTEPFEFPALLRERRAGHRRAELTLTVNYGIGLARHGRPLGNAVG